MNTQRGDVIRARVTGKANCGRFRNYAVLHNGDRAILADRLGREITGDIVVRVADPHPLVRADLSDIVTCNLVSTQVPDGFIHSRQENVVLHGEYTLEDVTGKSDFRMAEVKRLFDMGMMPNAIYYVSADRRVLAYALTWPSRKGNPEIRFNRCSQLMKKGMVKGENQKAPVQPTVLSKKDIAMHLG